LRDHVAGALDHDRVADAHVLALDLVAVVQRRVRDRHTADAHRLELRDRRQCTRASDLHFDREHGGGRLRRRELVRHRPARRARHDAELVLIGEPVDLHDRSVDLDRQRRASREQRVVRRDHRVDAAARDALGAGREPPVREPLERLALRLHAGRQPFADRVGAQLERAQPLAVDLVQHPQRPGGRVARVRERLGVAREPPLVQPLEARGRQDHLAAHRDPPGRVALQCERNARRDAQVRGDVLADAPVAARRADLECAVLVDQLDARAVELGLEHVVDRIAALEDPPHALVERAHLFLVHRVVEREHGHAVDELGEALGGRRSDALGRRVGSRELRVCGLELLELAEQRVVRGVADLRRVFLVIEAQMPGELGAQPSDPCARVRPPLDRQTLSLRRVFGPSSEDEIGAM
jgi:hypothetical protein